MLIQIGILSLYFFVGVLLDFFNTLGWKAVQQHRTIRAMTMSFVTVVLSMSVFYGIFVKLNEDRALISIIIYSFGVAVGTGLGMRVSSRWGT